MYFVPERSFQVLIGILKTTGISLYPTGTCKFQVLIGILKTLKWRPYTMKLKEKIREKIPYLENDRPIYRDMDQMEAMMRSGDFISLVEEKFHSIL